jgi:hypothetical protein
MNKKTVVIKTFYKKDTNVYFFDDDAAKNVHLLSSNNMKVSNFAIDNSWFCGEFKTFYDRNVTMENF